MYILAIYIGTSYLYRLIIKIKIIILKGQGNEKNKKHAIHGLTNNNLLFLKPKPFSPIAAEIYSINTYTET